MTDYRKLVMTCLLLAVVSAATAAAGEGLPTNLDEYLEGRVGGESAWHPFTVRQYNMRRAMNSELSAAKRADSLELVLHLAEDDEAVMAQIGSLVADEKTPEPLRAAALEALRRSDSPMAAEYIARAASGGGAATPESPEPAEPAPEAPETP